VGVFEYGLSSAPRDLHVAAVKTAHFAFILHFHIEPQKILPSENGI
jgi:hypothetical protein